MVFIEIYCSLYPFVGMLDAPTESTTNLHLDITDAVNVLINVTIPTGEDEEIIRESK
jgi:hypothetical protein